MTIASVLWDGESLTYGTAATAGFPDYFHAYASGVPMVNNFGIGGEPINTGATPTMVNSYPTNIAPLFNSQTANILHVLGGINDVGRGATDTDIQSAIQTYCGLARATGFKVYVSLNHKRGDTVAQGGPWTTTQEGYIVNYNAWMRANWPSFCDGIFDALTIIPELANPYNLSFFSTDKVHFTDYTQRLYARKLIDLFNLGPTKWWVPHFHSTATHIIDGSTYNWAGQHYTTNTGGAPLILAPSANIGSVTGIWNKVGTIAKGTPLNGYDTLDFTGSQSLTSNFSSTRNGNVTVFAVVKLPAITNALVSQGYDANASTGWVSYPRIAAGTFDGKTINASDLFSLGSGTATTNSYEIATCGWDTNHHIFASKIGNSNIVRFDGTSVYDVSRSKAVSNASLTAPVIIGNDIVTGNEFLTGQIAFLAVLGDASLDEIQQFEGWAAWKYNLVANLPVGHPYKTQAPTVQGLKLNPSPRFM